MCCIKKVTLCLQLLEKIGHYTLQAIVVSKIDQAILKAFLELA
jgi:hypothetical protein